MRRLHLFEIEDQRWCPRSIRDAVTDGLRFTIETMKVYEVIVSRLSAALRKMGSRRIVDLCSGGGGPWRSLLSSLERSVGGPLELCLTDFYPNHVALERVRAELGGRARFEPESVDAMCMPERLEGFRTLFTSFHHFRPEQAREILRDAVAKRQGIGIFEMTRRGVLELLMCFLAPASVLLTAPFIRPFRWSRMLWTYVIPLLIPIGFVDGVVSCLRTYSPEELRALVSGLGDVGYEWEIGEERVPGSPLVVTYLIGYPREAQR